MTKAEMLRRLNDVHRETLILVQKFSKEDFAKKAAGASWTALDLFAHLAAWNQEAKEALAQGIPVQECRQMSAETGKHALATVMTDFRHSYDSLAATLRRTPGSAGPGEVLDNAIRHYQTHQNDLKALIASFRPH